jgi:hypothetical protein
MVSVELLSCHIRLMIYRWKEECGRVDEFNIKSLVKKYDSYEIIETEMKLRINNSNHST